MKYKLYIYMNNINENNYVTNVSAYIYRHIHIKNIKKMQYICTRKKIKPNKKKT